MLMCFSDSWLFGSHGCIGFGWRLRIRTQSISLGWRVMMRIDAHFLHMFAVPQQACHLQDGESQCSEATRPKDDDQDHDKLGCNSTATDAGLAGSIIILHATEAAPTVVMVNAPAPIEQTCSDEPPGTAEAVHWAGIHWVINLELLQQHGSSGIHKTANQTSGKSTATFHITTACGDGHQARQDPIAQSTHIILLCDDVSEQEDGDATCCCSQARVVFIATWAARAPSLPDFMVKVEPGLKPYQPNHRAKVPRTTNGRLWHSNSSYASTIRWHLWVDPMFFTQMDLRLKKLHIQQCWVWGMLTCCFNKVAVYTLYGPLVLHKKHSPHLIVFSVNPGSPHTSK